MKSVYIILVNWNGWRDTVECLESLQRLDYSPFQVVVCDNGSSDDSFQQIMAWAARHKLACAVYQREVTETCDRLNEDPWLVMIRNEANLGFAGGNNVGIRYALARGDADFCWLLNNDTVVEPDTLSHLVVRMQQQPGIGMCGSTIRLYHDRARVQALGGGRYLRWIGLPWHYGRFCRVGPAINQKRAEAWMNYVEGASMLVSRRFLSEIGLMSEDYFLYFEETDWAERCKGKFKLGYAPQSVVFHKVGGSIGTSSNPFKKSFMCDYYNIRNRILFSKRYYPYALPTIYLVLVFELIVRFLLGKFRHAAMIFVLMMSGGKNQVFRS